MEALKDAVLIEKHMWPKQLFILTLLLSFSIFIVHIYARARTHIQSCSFVAVGAYIQTPLWDLSAYKLSDCITVVI